ncbi:MAG: hypothetical protein N2255_03975, partial [Kiritimatiellae bacterium]|nr:hypothetical protein [Kiritimatiellia bacterium]
PLFWSRAEEFLTVFYQKLLPETYHHRSSMLQDIRAGRSTEIDSLCGVVVRLGQKYGVPTPVNERMLESIRAISVSDRETT